MTAEDILTMIGQNSKSTTIDLGTQVGLKDPAEMYSNSVSNQKQKQKEKQNTFQQSSVNVGGASPAQFASQGASPPGVKKDQKNTGETKEINYGRRLSLQDLVVDIRCNLAKIREGDRHSRVTAYFSIRTEHDMRYMIFLRSSLTNAHYEILRSIDKDNNLPLRSIADDYIAKYNETGTLMLGRIRYKPTNNYVTEQHRKNHKHGLFALWVEDDNFRGELYLNGDYYPFEFSQDLTARQKESNYAAVAHWELDEGETE